MGYLHFFPTFPSASADAISELILSTTQPKAETVSLYLFKTFFFFFSKINRSISSTTIHNCRCPSYTEQSSLPQTLWCCLRVWSKKITNAGLSSQNLNTGCSKHLVFNPDSDYSFLSVLFLGGRGISSLFVLFRFFLMSFNRTSPDCHTLRRNTANKPLRP